MVLDASLASSWFLPRQATPAASALREELNKPRFVTPHYFGYEIRRVLLKAWRRGSLVAEDIGTSLAVLETAPIEVAAPPSASELDDIMELAKSEQLSFYDAVYLGLALQLELTLASRDASLLEAARRRGVSIYDARAAS